MPSVRSGVLNVTRSTRPPRKLIERLTLVPIARQFTSTITISEIVYGAHESRRPEYHIDNLEWILLPAVNVLGFDANLPTSPEKSEPTSKLRDVDFHLPK